MNNLKPASFFRQILTVLAGVLVFIIIGPVAGSNIFGLLTLYIGAYLMGTVPASLAGVIFSLVTLWLFKSNKLESAGMWLRVGSFRGALIGLLTAFIFFVCLSKNDSHSTTEGVIGFSLFFGFCGVLGGAASGHLAEKAMRQIYFGTTK